MIGVKKKVIQTNRFVNSQARTESLSCCNESIDFSIPNHEFANFSRTEPIQLSIPKHLTPHIACTESRDFDES